MAQVTITLSDETDNSVGIYCNFNDNQEGQKSNAEMTALMALQILKLICRHENMQVSEDVIKKMIN